MYNKARIVKIKKNPRGELTDVMLDNGNVYSIDEVIMMAKDGLIEDVFVEQDKYNGEQLKSKKAGIENDNLNNLPQF